jgi:hypothetical protein
MHAFFYDKIGDVELCFMVKNLKFLFYNELILFNETINI